MERSGSTPPGGGAGASATASLGGVGWATSGSAAGGGAWATSGREVGGGSGSGIRCASNGKAGGGAWASTAPFSRDVAGPGADAWSDPSAGGSGLGPSSCADDPSAEAADAASAASRWAGAEAGFSGGDSSLSSTAEVRDRFGAGRSGSPRRQPAARFGGSSDAAEAVRRVAVGASASASGAGGRSSVLTLGASSSVSSAVSSRVTRLETELTRGEVESVALPEPESASAGRRAIRTPASGACASVRPVKSPRPSSCSAITVYDDPGRSPRSVNAPERSVVARTTLPPGALPTASRTRALAAELPCSSTTRPEILPSGLARSSGATRSDARIAPGSPVTTGNGLSPIVATVRILDETPVVLAQPTRQRGRVRRRNDGLKVHMAAGSSS